MQLGPVRDALIAVEHPISILGWLRKSESARLLARLAAEDQPITHDLLDELPQTRNLQHVRQVLVHTGVLPERVEHLERITPWLNSLLATAPRRHAVLLRPYAQWAVLHRARRSAQKRPYSAQAGRSARRRIQVAAEFLSWLDDRDLAVAALTQRDLDEWLSSGTTGRYDIRTFVRWAVRHKLAADLRVPARSRKQLPTRVMSDDERNDQLRRCLTDDSLPLGRRGPRPLPTRQVRSAVGGRWFSRCG